MAEYRSDCLKVSYIDWSAASEYDAAQSQSIEELGHAVTHFMSTDRIPAGSDVVFSSGPFGSLVPVANQLLALPPERRPLFGLWMSEQFWNPRLPTFLGYPISRLRSRIERWAYRRNGDGLWQVKPGWQRLLSKALRFRYYGDIDWLQRVGVLSLLAVHSPWIVNFLKRSNLRSILAYTGYSTNWSSPLNLDRDIPVLWLGKPGSNRRRRLLREIRQQLRQRGVELLVIDGVEHPYVFGEERTRLLNRTKIVLNVLREPWDNNYLRYLFAMSNGALVVTEPTLHPLPFQDRIHLAVAPIDQLADTLIHYLTHETDRQALADRAYEFITTQMTMRQGAATIFDRINIMREHRS